MIALNSLAVWITQYEGLAVTGVRSVSVAAQNLPCRVSHILQSTIITNRTAFTLRLAVAMLGLGQSPLWSYWRCELIVRSLADFSIRRLITVDF